MRNAIVALILAAAVVTPALAQDTRKTDSPDPTSALEFLGSYSAPSAVLATETSHTSAHPPSPSADRRLRELSTPGALLPPWPTDLVWSVQAIEEACGHAALPRSGARPSRPQSDQPRAKEAPAQPSPSVATWTQLVLGAHRDLADGHYAEAARDYDRLLVKRPACSPLVWNRALARAYARHSEALTDLLAALPGAPSAESGRLLVGLELVANGNFSQAREYLDPPANSHSASNAEPRKRDLRWARAAWLRSTGDPRQARQTLEGLADLEPATAAVWFALGSAALDEARVDSRRLTQIAPDSSWNRQLEAEALSARYPNLAHTLWPGAVANRSTAEEDVHPAAASSESPEQLYRAAHSALQTAVKAYAAAAVSPEFSAELHGLRALAAEQQDDEAAAFREYWAGLAEDASSAILHAGLGHLYRERSQFGAAKHELTEAQGLDPSDPVVTFELGDVCLRLGDATRALDLLNRAVDLDPTLLVARWSRGKAYVALGDDRRALDDLAAAAPVDSTGELQWQLARVYRKLGRTGLAQAAEQRSEEQRRVRGNPQKAEDPKP